MRLSTNFACLLLALAGISSASSYAQSVTTHTMSARTRALREMEASQPSSLEALPEAVDESLDRQVEADVQAIFQDSSLMRSGTGESDAGGKSSPVSSDDGRLLSRRTASAATALSPLPTVLPNPEAEPTVPSLPGHPVAELPHFPVGGPSADPGDSFLLRPGASPQPKKGLSRIKAEKQEREQRRTREQQNKSDRQCGQLRSGAAECRLKLNKANASETGTSDGNFQTRR